MPLRWGRTAWRTANIMEQQGPSHPKKRKKQKGKEKKEQTVNYMAKLQLLIYYCQWLFKFFAALVFLLLVIVLVRHFGGYSTKKQLHGEGDLYVILDNIKPGSMVKNFQNNTWTISLQYSLQKSRYSDLFVMSKDGKLSAVRSLIEIRQKMIPLQVTELVILSNGFVALNRTIQFNVGVIGAEEKIRFDRESYVAHFPENKPTRSYVDGLNINVYGMGFTGEKPRTGLMMVQPEIYCNITEGNDNNVFEILQHGVRWINHTDGGFMSTRFLLKTNASLDRETQSEYKLKVEAYDSKIADRASTYITLYVDDQNDNTPVFSKSEYVFTVQRKSSLMAITSAPNCPKIIGRINATDPDVLDMREKGLVYSLQEPSDIVGVRSETGDVLLLRDPSELPIGFVVRVFVIASDMRIPIHFSKPTAVEVRVVSAEDTTEIEKS